MSKPLNISGNGPFIQYCVPPPLFLSIFRVILSIVFAIASCFDWPFIIHHHEIGELLCFAICLHKIS